MDVQVRSNLWSTWCLSSPRIKRMAISEYARGDIFLKINAHCRELTLGKLSVTYFMVDAEFWKYSGNDEAIIGYPMPDFAVMGHDYNAEWGIKNAIRATMEKALLVYLKENFAL